VGEKGGKKGKRNSTEWFKGGGECFTYKRKKRKSVLGEKGDKTGQVGELREKIMSGKEIFIHPPNYNCFEKGQTEVEGMRNGILREASWERTPLSGLASPRNAPTCWLVRRRTRATAGKKKKNVDGGGEGRNGRSR